tara:strand:- start:114 stop:281 length:168 start_codon:yes stop_codon:yes gene_type:complete
MDHTEHKVNHLMDLMVHHQEEEFQELHQEEFQEQEQEDKFQEVLYYLREEDTDYQ